MCFLLHFLLRENDVSDQRCNVLAWPVAVHECDKITALVMEREGRHLRQSLLTKTAWSQERERKLKGMERV